MFLIRSTHERRKTLSDTSPTPAEDAAARKARHLRLCEEMQELGMVLLRRAAMQAAQAELTNGEPTPDDNAQNALTFARLTRSINATIALEARIAADSFARPSKYPPFDPRRVAVRRALQEATTRHPDHDRLQLELEEAIDRALAKDPDETANMPTLFHSICKELAVTPDYAMVSNEILDILCEDEPEKPPITATHGADGTSHQANAHPIDSPPPSSGHGTREATPSTKDPPPSLPQ